MISDNYKKGIKRLSLDPYCNHQNIQKGKGITKLLKS